MFDIKPPAHASEAQRLRHPSWRRYTRQYRRKQRIVRDVWIVSAIAMLGSPLGAIPILALGTTVLAFMILDETP